MRGIILSLVLFGGVVRGEVLVYDQATLGPKQGLTVNSQKIGQSFKNTAGQGFTVSSIMLAFSVQSGTTLGGTASVNIFAASGAAGSYLPTGTALATSQALSLAGFNSALETDKVFTFTSGTGLDLNQTYIAQLDISNLTGLGVSNQFYVYYKSGIPSPPSPLAGLNAYLNNGTGDAAQTYQLYGTISMVPEPGTLLLGGIAVACGGGGVWWRRKRKAAPVVEEEAAAAV